MTSERIRASEGFSNGRFRLESTGTAGTGTELDDRAESRFRLRL